MSQAALLDDVPAVTPAEDACPKCGGSGKWVGRFKTGNCFACKGSGRRAASLPAAAAQPRRSVDVTPIIRSFETARGKGIKTPRMRIGRFLFKRAPDHGRNPGAIYVMQGDHDLYCGKILNGELHMSRGQDITTDMRDEIVALCADPLTAAVAYGKQYGRCSCCGRELTDPDSIAAGIGPICAETFGL